VELGGHDVLFADAADEGAAVVGGGCDHGRFFRDDVVAVDEVDACAARQIVEEGRGVFEIELVPAHVGDFQAQGLIDVEPHAFAFEHAQALMDAVFVADIEEHLQAQADAEEWFAIFDVRDDGRRQLFFPQSADGVREGAYAGEDDFFGLFDLARGGDDVGGDADGFEGFLNRAKVGHAVIDDGDRHE
jgi:hypothetical protein